MANVKQVVPFLSVNDMRRSLPFYSERLGFTIKYRWIDEGYLRWCWLELGGAALMLQEYSEGPLRVEPGTRAGVGVSLCFQCEDAIALYREFRSRGVAAKTPFVGNQMWVTEIADPDGYALFFESATDAPEESVYSE